MYTSVRRAKWNWGFVGRPLRSWWYSWLRVTSEECEIQPDPIWLHLQAASKVKFTFEIFWDPTHIPSWSKLPICAKSGLVLKLNKWFQKDIYRSIIEAFHYCALRFFLQFFVWFYAQNLSVGWIGIGYGMEISKRTSANKLAKQRGYVSQVNKKVWAQWIPFPAKFQTESTLATLEFHNVWQKVIWQRVVVFTGM